MKKSKIFAVVNQKGGVAKTSSALILGDILASKGYSCLLVDLDAQSSLTISSGIEPEGIPSMYDVLCEDTPIEDIILCGISDKGEKLCLAPTDITLSVAELSISNMMNRDTLLKRKLASVVESFDYIIIDCSPSLSLLTINALVACDSVIVPSSAEYLSYRGLKLLMDTIDRIKANEHNQTLDIKGVIVTLFDSRTLHHREVYDLINSKYPVLGCVGISTAVRDAVLQGKSLYTINPKHKISQQYLNITEALLNE